MKAISGNKVSGAFYRDVRKARFARERAKLQTDWRVYQLKKDGDRYKNPCETLSGAVDLTEAEADEMVERLNRLNPGATFVKVRLGV